MKILYVSLHDHTAGRFNMNEAITPLHNACTSCIVPGSITLLILVQGVLPSW